jgi:hypothetical protein
MPEYDNTNKGVAFRNDYRKEDKHPNFKGKGNFNGQDFDIAIWERTSPKGQFFSISFSEPYEKEMREQEQSGYDKAKQARESLQNTTDYDSPIDLSSIPF